MRNIKLFIFIVWCLISIVSHRVSLADEWTQTSKDDFDNGTKQNVSTQAIAGAVELERQLIYSEDFSSQTATDWTLIYGTWSIIDGSYKQSKTHLKVWQFGETGVNEANDTHLSYPMSVQRLDTGNTLICDTVNHRTIEVNSSGSKIWQFGVTGVDGVTDSHLYFPYDARRLSSGNTLISDSNNARIIEVTSAGVNLWQFGETSFAGGGDSRVNFPVEAHRLSSGNTLVSDLNNARVMEIFSGIGIWQFGETGVTGEDDEHLNNPMSVQRLSNGNTVICDSNNHRIIEVDSASDKVWQFGETKTSGADDSHLNLPVDVKRLSSGSTLISDKENHRVIEVDTNGNKVWQFGIAETSGSDDFHLYSPVDAERLANGNTLICDSDNHRVLEINSMGNMSIYTGSTYDNRVFQATVNQDSTSSLENEVYLYFRYQDTANFYVLVLDYANDTVRLIKNKSSSTDSGITLLGQGSHTLSQGIDYTVRVKAWGSSLAGFVDGVEAAIGTDTDFTDGYFGLGTGNGVIASFDDVKVYGNYQSTGTFISQVFDSGRLGTIWGTIRWTCTVPSNTTCSLNTCSGNSATVDSTWSEWSSDYTASTGETVASPASRYIQYRINFDTSDSTVSPLVEEVSIESVTGISDVKIGPNPYNPKVDANFTLYYESTNDTIEAKIFTISGELVYEFASSEVLPTMVRWNGKNQKGETVSSGFYILHIKTTSPFSGKETVVNKKFAVIK